MTSDARAGLPNTHWRKSSYSTGTGNCVELALMAEDVLLRDTKSPESGTLAGSRGAWQELARAVTQRTD